MLLRSCAGNCPNRIQPNRLCVVYLGGSWARALRPQNDRFVFRSFLVLSQAPILIVPAATWRTSERAMLVSVWCQLGLESQSQIDPKNTHIMMQTGRVGKGIKNCNGVPGTDPPFRHRFSGRGRGKPSPREAGKRFRFGALP